jgi:putative membrane fusion protein
MILGAGTFALLGGLTWARGVVLPFLIRSRPAQFGTIEESFDAEAAVVRKESVYVAGISGILRPLVGEGERVRAGTAVVEIANPQSRKAAEERLAEIDRKIEEFDRRNAAEYESLRERIRGWNSTITGLVSSIREAYSFDDPDAVAAAEDELSEALDGRAEAARGIEALDASRRELLVQRQGLEELLRKSVTLVECRVPGIVSFRLDGCEKEFSPERLKDIGARTIFTAEPTIRTSVDGAEARAGEPVCRVVEADEWYLAVGLPSNRVPQLGGSSVRVRLPETGERQIPARVARLDTGPPGGYAIMILEADNLPSELLSVRKTRATVITSSTQGVLVPRSAVVKVDGKTGVYAIYKTMAQFKPVQVRAQDDDGAIVEGLSPGTEVITNPWLAKEGRRVK